ncbi:MAG: 3-methyl-2-oxobutanoate hydroxymethyltransferase [Phycisphaerae bacterium]|nr:3-methyl-2-oxobutanoate hydroxymethyltransferase [Phycisphaerae bacterium]
MNASTAKINPKRVTLATLRRMAATGDPFACLTCYDATTARWLARAGVHVLLVGDTAAEVVLGLSRTIDMPLEVLLALTAGVKRGAPESLVMGDMPFMSYQADEPEAIRNAGRFLREGLADVVKFEADESFAPLIAKVVRAGIPVCGHVGSRPQRAALTSGYASAGRSPADAERIVRDAVAMERAGCSLLLVEAVPEAVASEIMRVTTVPLIGIGAGAGCHGQVVVLQDVMGLNLTTPPFVRPVASMGEALERAARSWVDQVARRDVPPSPYTGIPADDGSAPHMRPDDAVGRRAVQVDHGDPERRPGRVNTQPRSVEQAGNKPLAPPGARG